jgi:hypothetical protein
VADLPILFSAPMVRALLAGTKTQTRRIVKPQPELLPNGLYHVHNRGGGMVGVAEENVGRHAVDYLRIATGDQLYVRETWTHTGTGVWTIADSRHALDGQVAYQADGAIPGAKYWPSIHMPREFSRLTLTVTDVRVERLQEISETDAVAEGCKVVRDACYVFDGTAYDRGGLCHSSPVTAYSILWNDINGDSAWDANPWVAAYTFTVERRNIDARGAA